MQYGTVDDLRRATDSVNVTNQIAIVKLGQAPLLYKVRPNRSAADTGSHTCHFIVYTVILQQEKKSPRPRNKIV